MKLTETTARFANNPEYVRYERLLIELVQAICADDENLADRLRDDMEEPEAHLNGAEILRLNGLAGDSYSLYDNELLESFKGTPQEYADAVQAAYRSNDFIAILKLLRKEQDKFDKAQVAFLRFRMYEELGHVNTATLFLNLAMRLDPTRLAYTVRYFAQLHQLGRVQEIVDMARKIIEDNEAAPELKIEAGSSLHMVARNIPLTDALSMHELAISGVLEGLDKLQDKGNLPHNVRADGYMTLGMVYSWLDRNDEAIAILNHAIELDPYEVETHGLRGLLLQGSDREQSKKDLMRAIELNTQSPQPYIALCRMALQEHDPGTCLLYAEKLKLIAKDDPDLAQCYELIAISSLIQNGPSEFVCEHFKAAASLDPLNIALAEKLLMYQELERAIGQAVVDDMMQRLSAASANETVKPRLRRAA